MERVENRRGQERRKKKKLTQPKEEISREDGVDAGPEEAGLGAPVPLVGAELAVADDVDEGDVDGVVDVAREDDALGAQARRRHLGHDGVHDGADGEVGRRAEKQHQRPGRPGLGCAGVRGDSQEADYAGVVEKLRLVLRLVMLWLCLFVFVVEKVMIEGDVRWRVAARRYRMAQENQRGYQNRKREQNSQQEHENSTHAADHERLAADLIKNKPARDGADEVDSVLPPAQLERIAVRDASLLVEKRRQAAQRRPGQGLREPGHADDFGAPYVDALEAVLVRRAGCALFFHLVGVDHYYVGRY